MAFMESVKRRKPEEDAMEAKSKAEAVEYLYTSEINLRKQLEVDLGQQRQESERMRIEVERYINDLHTVWDLNLGLENRIKESQFAMKNLEEKMISAANLLISFKNKRDRLKVECDNTTREIERLKKLKEEKKATRRGGQFTIFSFTEIYEATRGFDRSNRKGEGRYGSVYRGIIRHVTVAIKMLPNDGGSHGHLNFIHEVELLSRVRHPNLVTLAGICPESRTLVYEYVEKGSLEDHIGCHDNNRSPLPWRTRVGIAIEICSALIFLHTNNPPIIHGNLKPTNILLDLNYVTRITDFGISSLAPTKPISIYGTYSYDKTGPCSEFAYIDPEFLQTGGLTVESDVFSFGVILLRLLTGMPAYSVVKDVQYVMENGNFENVLDFSAGYWPIEQTKGLARLGLRCCDSSRSNRPSLASDIWSMLQMLRNSSDGSTYSSDSKKLHKIPSHFLCPIFQEVMKEPCTAADGYTYERDAIEGWLSDNRKTSPMTNLNLPHCDLIPNLALRQAIQEWMLSH